MSKKKQKKQINTNENEEKIFALETNIHDEKLKQISKKYSISEIETGMFDSLCANTTDVKIFKNSKLYFPIPNPENTQFILGTKTFDEICSDEYKQEFIKTTAQLLDEYINNKNGLDKTSFQIDFHALKIIPRMNEEEAIKYISNLPSISLDEWIESMPDLLYISNYSLGNKQIPKIETQSKIFNELLSHFFTVELIYAISEEIDETKNNNSNGLISINKIESEPFMDIKQIIKQKNPELSSLYDRYYLLKCLCFILHDKPVNQLAPFLLEFFKPRILSKSDTNTNTLIQIFMTGFNIGANNAMVTQSRCHKTIDGLTNYFYKIMKSKNINVPEIINVFQVPYSAFKLENKSKIKEDDDETVMTVTKEMKRALLHYDYGLGDAVGTDTFINSLNKTSIYPDTLSKQDATGSTHSTNEIIVSEDNLEYKISQGGVVKRSIKIEPLRFMDIAILCVKDKNKKYFLYYANIGFTYDENNYSNLPLGFQIPKEYYFYNDGIKKTLIGIITGVVSQNDTISLFTGIIDISTSTRGTGKIYINPNIWWLNKGMGTKEETNAKIILAAFAKEVGDQSKIQVIENLSRNGFRSYVATVDSFFSKSFINGGVLWKGGTVSIFIPQGFETPTKEQMMNTSVLLEKVKYYGIEKIKNKMVSFGNQIVNIITKIIADPTVKLPDAVLFSLYALQSQMGKISIRIEESNATFDKLYNGGKYDAGIHSGIRDVPSFLRRFLHFDKIYDIFSLLENELDESFSVKLGTTTYKGMEGIIEKYLGQIDVLHLFSFKSPVLRAEMNEEGDADFAFSMRNGVKETEPEIRLFLEQFPLFYLMRNINIIRNYKFHNRKQRKVSVPVFIDINSILKEILLTKLNNYCRLYDIPHHYLEEYIRIHNLPVLSSTQEKKEDVFDDTSTLVLSLNIPENIFTKTMNVSKTKKRKITVSKSKSPTDLRQTKKARLSR